MSAASEGAVPQIDSTRNYYLHAGKPFRFQCTLIYWPPKDASLQGETLVRIDVERVAGREIYRMRPLDLRVVDTQDKDQRFIILRGTRVLAGNEVLKPGDRLVTTIRRGLAPSSCDVALVIWGAEKVFPNPVYGQLETDQRLADAVDDERIDVDRGLLDYTGPVDLRQPASIIQMDMIYSARWNLWYEFAGWSETPSTTSIKRRIAVPVNPLWISTREGSNSTCFNMDDVPRFPLHYARWFRATGDRRALLRARQGLETILNYTRPDGTMPYLLAPWNGEHHEGGNFFDIYHSMRAMAEGIPVFKQDKALHPRLIEAYERYRSYVFAHLDQGLFQGRASGNGVVIEAVYNRWQDTHSDRDLGNIRTLADAICTDHARTQKSDFGEYIPWVPIGLILAYDATKDRKYRREAEDWYETTIIPSLQQDRRFYHAVPDFMPSGHDKTGGENPLQIWYNADALLTMYRVTGDQKYYDLAAWVYGDYYDFERYSLVSARIVDTGKEYTEIWGSASAEDALRMAAKYIWQIRYPSLYQDIRVKAKVGKQVP